jgi:Na+-transporting NADH:ubiquinone oxidoreductase subunit C
MGNDTVGKTILVAVLLCIICSVLVSTAAVKLKPLQTENKEGFTRTNILKAAGLMEPGKSIDELFKNIEVRYVDLNTGEYSDVINAATFDQKKAVKDPKYRQLIPEDLDLASIKARSKISEVYLVKHNGALETIILPVYGKGLWSTMYAFLAVAADGNTIKGYSFYDHGETPGLGGEIENPSWLAKWQGKKIYDNDLNLAINVLKGKVDTSKPEAIHQVDGLSGATLTTVGVRNLMKYWLGDSGFKKFLANMQKQGAVNG